MNKRLFAWLVVACLMLGMIPNAEAAEIASGTCGESLTWVLDDNGTLTISGQGEMGFYAYDAPPWHAYRNEITMLNVEEGVTSIGSNAFFFYPEEDPSEPYPNLSAVKLPSTLETISSEAFRRTGIKSIVIPEGVTYIGTAAFTGCEDLEYVKLPSTLDSMGYSVFSNCISLATVDMSGVKNNVSSYDCFSNCDALTNIDFYGFSMISGSAFNGCDGFTVLNIPEGVTTILGSAFANCSNLSEVVFPKTLETINRCFLDCPNMNTVWFTGDAPSGDKPFYGVTATAYYPGGNDTWTQEVMDALSVDASITWVSYVPNPFTDVPADSFYYDPVLWALENEITSGATATTFNPNGACLRAQVVTFLWRAEGCPEPESSVNPFVDVKASDFYYDAVLWAVEKGITNGADATHFNPMGVCNRAQVVTFLHRTFGAPAVEGDDNPFADVPTGGWYTVPVLWAVEQGVTNGLSATEFGPNADCNRAQIVTFLYRAYTD